MSSTLVIMTHWVLNEDKWFTYYDNKVNKEFSTGQTKEFKYQDSDKMYKMFEHKLPLSGKLVKSTGVDGYQYRHQKYTVIVAFGRRMKEGKVYQQELDDVLFIMGLKEREPKVVDVSGNVVDVSGNNN
jgi:hypothetical protein